MLVLCYPAFFFVDFPYAIGEGGRQVSRGKRVIAFTPGKLTVIEECVCLSFQNYMLMELFVLKDGLPENGIASPWGGGMDFKWWLPTGS